MGITDKNILDLSHLCMGCMQSKGAVSKCPDCGFDERDFQREPFFLKYRTKLSNQFLIGRLLGAGAFGITYLGWDLRLETIVAIKEFIPQQWAYREGLRVVPLTQREIFEYGLDSFLKEARTLAKFNHPNVMRVRTLFEENDTAYIVMDYCKGESLEGFLQRRKGTCLSEKEAVDVIKPVLDGLEYVHEKGYLHRDIKPANIYLPIDHGPMLIDFGAARFAIRERSKSLTIIYSSGYAPFEQYLSKCDQGHWTDIYACGATIYRMVTGEIPPDANDRINEVRKRKKDPLVPPQKFNPDLSQNFSDAIIKALSIEIEDRPQSVKDFQKLLFNTKKEWTEPITRMVWTEPITGMVFVWVPGEEFMMGSNKYDDEKPIHEVKLDGFWMGKYPVTQKEWKVVMNDNPSNFKKGDNYPAERVSWDDTQIYIKKLEGLNNGKYKFSLPTEAQWEYACRAGTKTGYYFGDTISKKQANFGSTCTTPVGSYPPNAFNLYDMHGNIWEWCKDIYAADAYNKHTYINPENETGGSDRVLRGGSWRSDYVFYLAGMDSDPRSARRKTDMRSAHRVCCTPASRITYFGFRLLRTL